jgi:hypothetical protein
MMWFTRNAVLKAQLQMRDADLRQARAENILAHRHIEKLEASMRPSEVEEFNRPAGVIPICPVPPFPELRLVTNQSSGIHGTNPDAA